MYKIEHHNNQQSNEIKLINSNKTSYAVIALNLGASLQKLTFKNTTIIEDLLPLKYTETYPSSILFPFANRIKDGIYTFNKKQYQVEANHKKENNALHGFVFDKTFKILSKNVSNSEASISLEYKEFEITKGFPYTYTVQLVYTLNEEGLNLKATVKNTDANPFPFTIGWHPYFASKNLYNSKVKFDCSKKVVLGDRMITTGVEDYTHKDSLQIEDKQLDDCFILNSNKIQFLTPEYDLEMTSSSKETFLQLFTPPKKNIIAIEPTTGISDSFNNKIGLQILEPDETYTIDWNITLHLKK